MREQLNIFLNILGQYNGKFTKPINDSICLLMQTILKEQISIDDYTLNEREKEQVDYTIMFMVVKGIQLLFDDIKLGHFVMLYSGNGGHFYNDYDPMSGPTSECYGCQYLNISQDKYHFKTCKMRWFEDQHCPYKLDLKTETLDRLEFFIIQGLSRIKSLLDEDEIKYVEFFTKYKTKRSARLHVDLFDSLSCVIVKKIIDKYPVTLKLCNQLIQNHC